MLRFIRSRFTASTLISSVTIALVLFLGSATVLHAQVGATAATIVGNVPQAVKDAKETVWDSFVKAGRISLINSLRAAVNQLAFETATYIGSGASGQKPLFYTEPFPKWLNKQADKAAGNFIEEFSKARKESGGNQLVIDKIFANKFDICSVDLNVQARISLGLTDYSGISGGVRESRCTLTNIYKDTLQQFDTLYGGQDPQKRAEYFKNLALGSFHPATTDLGASLSIFDAFKQEVSVERTDAEKNRIETGGWQGVVSTISGDYIAPPETVKKRLNSAQDRLDQSFWKESGDVFIDAANIFLNQLALTAFNRLIQDLGKPRGSSSSVTDFAGQNTTGGVTEIQQRASTILQARFNERADYNVLAQLSSCTNEDKPGPTNCVITEQFAQAIQKRLSVAQAIKDGLIDANKRLGYDEQGNEMSYRDGYPYRSLVILRKYRVLPVGWEVAAQYIKMHPQETKNRTLNDLIACFSDTDNAVYPGFHEAWCDGLIDPSWVLKIPQMFCGMEGYGPELLSASTIPSNTGYCAASKDSCTGNSGSAKCKSDFTPCTETGNECAGNPSGFTFCNFTVGRDLEVTRNDSYCADEQSCIKENANGSCAYYGYCSEEKRRWVFNQETPNSCEPRNNTCQSFRSDEGATASYLENTLDYENCGPNEVGCKAYATTGTYTSTTDKVTWNESQDLRYFNKNLTNCDSTKEGCHEFIRTSDNIDTNLIANGSFESSACISNINSETLLPDQKNPLINKAAAQSGGACELSTISAPGGNLASPNNNWYIRVNSGTAKAGIVNDKSDHGANSLYVEGAAGVYSVAGGTPNLLPTGFVFEPERYYTLTVSVNVSAGAVRAGFGTPTVGQSAQSTATNSWQTLVVNYYTPRENVPNTIFIEGVDSSAKFYIDSVKLTPGQASTSYTDYFGANVVYEKLLPAYLESACYVNPGTDYHFKANAPLACFKFARKCTADEVGCVQYNSVDTGISVTGKVKAKDYCPSSCVGYNVFIQQPNNFNALESAYFIPNTAKSCSAQAVGCTAFTNLDKLASGGEAVENYSYLRRCIKPNASSCDQFYSWEGSDESGYQLKVFSLQKSGSEPASTMSPEDEALVCNAAIFKKLPSEPGYNYDCREFYGRDGTVSYHLYTKTISCSEDCHPYRREVANAAECSAGGGDWDASQGRCLYYAIPSEGTSCSAAEVGCQEYTGNIAGNVRTVLIDDFESVENPTAGWVRGVQSNTALNLGGRSLLGTDIEKIVGESVRRNYSYTISFLAKAQAGSTVISSIDLHNKDNQVASFMTNGAGVTNSDWRLYTFNLTNLDHEVTPKGGPGTGPGGSTGEALQIKFSGAVYIDNIRLTEVPNRYYLIKNSWQTPDECDQDITGAYALHYMLGCSKYTDSSNQPYNLHSFSQLCQDSAAGCEQMIDTQNSRDNRKKLYNDTNGDGICQPIETSCVAVPADTMINVVYDKTKLCDLGAKGCSRFGQATKYDNISTFSDVYKKADPETYNSTICNSNAVGCSQWSDSSGGVVYFKDPGNQVCEWRLKQGLEANNYGWFEKKVKRCGPNGAGALCGSDSDCTNGQTCAEVSADIPCAYASDKTIGPGGSTGRVSQPSEWAGACNADQAGCTEYIEPLSKINDNLIQNPDYLNLDTDPQVEEWNNGTEINTAIQQVSLFEQTAYILKGDIRENPGSNPVSVKIRCDGGNQNNGEGLRILDSANNFTLCKTNDDPNCLSANTSELTIGKDKSIIFYIQRNSANQSSNSNGRVDCTITRTNSKVGEANNISSGVAVYLRQAIVDYQLSQNLDRTSHNGLVNNNQGAVLFNERAQAGNKKAPLVYNADATYDTPPSQGVAPQTTNPKNANVLLKVTPDRICSKWLSCTTYLPDPNDPSKKTCLNVGLCDSLDANGNCNSFIDSPSKKNQEITRTSISNLTGYSKVGYYGLNSNNQPESALKDFYNLGEMTQVGQLVSIVNSGFETQGGWNKGDSFTPKFLTQPGQISSEGLNQYQPVKGQVTGDFLAPEGHGILKIPSEEFVRQNEPISLSSGQRYVLTFYSYSKGAGLEIKMESQTGSGTFTVATIGQNDPQNQWVKQSFGIEASASSYKIYFKKNGGGDAYIDDVRIEAGLNNRCSLPGYDQSDCSDLTPPSANPPILQRPEFIGSTCRLYAKENSLSCLYTDKDNVTHKGIRGYCLENDPKDPGTCLLWYPVSRIAGDTTEEGTNVNFGDNGTFYCIDAIDKCTAQNSGIPAFYCNKFVKVDTSIYFNKRISQGSSYKMPDESLLNGNKIFPVDPLFYPTGQMKIELGGSTPTANIPALLWGQGDGYFGSYQPTAPFNAGDHKYLTVDTNNYINSFISYYGASTNQRCTDQTRFTNQSWASIPDPQFYGHEKGSGSSSSLDIIGEWDTCQVTAAYDVDFNGECGDSCKAGDVEDFKGPLEYGSCGVNSGCCKRFTQFGGCAEYYTDTKCSHCANGASSSCNAYRENGTGRHWRIDVFDANSDSDDPSCAVQCFNQTGEYKIVDATPDAGTSQALDVLRRLYPGTAAWKVYSWVDGANPQYSTKRCGGTGAYCVDSSTCGAQQCIEQSAFSHSYGLSECNGTGLAPRPLKNETNNNDYCLIYPKVTDVRVNGINNQDIEIDGSQYVALSFNTQTDPEQLPLKHITVNWGYSDEGQNPEKFDLDGNMADVNPRQITHRYSYYELAKNPQASGNDCRENSDPICKGATACCIAQPEITIIDNWGQKPDTPQHVVQFSKKIIVKKP